MAIDPLTLGSQLALYMKNGTGLFQDAALTTPVAADGDPVGGWQDQSGNGRTMGQAVAADRPTFRSGVVNGLPVVRFADGTDHLDSQVAFSVAQPFYVFWASTQQAGVAKRKWSNLNAGPALVDTNGTWGWNAGTASVNFAGLGQSGWGVQMFYANGALTQARRNGVTVNASADPGGNGLSSGFQYDINGVQANLHDLLELFIVTGSLTECQIQGLLLWLQNLVTGSSSSSAPSSPSASPSGSSFFLPAASSSSPAPSSPQSSALSSGVSSPSPAFSSPAVTPSSPTSGASPSASVAAPVASSSSARASSSSAPASSSLTVSASSSPPGRASSPSAVPSSSSLLVSASPSVSVSSGASAVPSASSSRSPSVSAVVSASASPSSAAQVSSASSSRSASASASVSRSSVSVPSVSPVSLSPVSSSLASSSAVPAGPGLVVVDVIVFDGAPALVVDALQFYTTVTDVLYLP